MRAPLLASLLLSGARKTAGQIDHNRRSFTPDQQPETPMSPMSFQQFEDHARAQGFDEVLERHWDAHTLLDTHSHPFAVSARVVEGGFWLTVGEQTRHLQAGDSFELDADVPHAERYGAEGARSWVARRNRPATAAG
jgi:hypothetical protein